jgi:protein-disulfide isomerase
MPMFYRFALVCSLILAAFSPMSPARAEISPAQKSEFEALIGAYLKEHPEVVRDAMAELERRQKEDEDTARQKAISGLSDQIFNSSMQAVVGNPNGKVTLVEFFDYNCGYCRRTLEDITRLSKEDNDLRIVLKDFPVLGPGSVEAAQIAIALRNQFKGDKYWDFHQKLLSTRGQVGKTQALSVAKDLGADLAKVNADSANPVVRASIEEVMKIADGLNLTGTPSFVLGDEVIVGAVGYDELKAKISSMHKCGKTACG